MSLSRRERQVVENILTAYPLKQALIVEKQRQYGAPATAKLDGVNIQSSPGDPVATAVRQMEDDEAYQEARRVVRVVEDTLPCLTDTEREVVAKQYWSNKNRTQEGYAMMIGVSRRTFQRHLYSAMWKFAQRLGCTERKMAQ